MSPDTLRSYLISLSPLQVQKEYFHSGPWTFGLAAKSMLIIEALLWLVVVLNVHEHYLGARDSAWAVMLWYILG